MQDNFGQVMKDWRQIRRISQMELSGMADVSARHISFLETGRSRPTRGMVLRLAEVLLLPPTARDRMLIAAGMAPVARQRRLNERELAPLTEAMQWMLHSHAPYPALALDRHWRVIAANPPAQGLLEPVGLGIGDSLLEAFLFNTALRDNIDNLAEVERFMCARLRTELVEVGQDPVLEDAIRAFETRRRAEVEDIPPSADVVLATRYRVGPHVLSLFSTISHFGGANDELFSELKIELMFPADPQTGQVLRALASV